jgi:hypothetical protein
VRSYYLNSFLRESVRLYTLYMIAGVVAIPALSVYAVLSVEGYDFWWIAVAAIALGFLMAIKAWKYFDRLLFTRAFAVSGAMITWPLIPATAMLALALSQSPVVPAAEVGQITLPQAIDASIVLTTDQPVQLTEQPALTY